MKKFAALFLLALSVAMLSSSCASMGKGHCQAQKTDNHSGR